MHQARTQGPARGRTDRRQECRAGRHETGPAPQGTAEGKRSILAFRGIVLGIIFI